MLNYGLYVLVPTFGHVRFSELLNPDTYDVQYEAKSMGLNKNLVATDASASISQASESSDSSF